MSLEKDSAPKVVSLPLWRAITLGLIMWVFVTSVCWWLDLILLEVRNPGRYPGFRSDPPIFPPLTTDEIFVGSGILLSIFLTRWAWHSRQFWRRWLSTLFTMVYLYIGAVWSAVSLLGATINYPRNLVVNGTLIMLHILLWFMPILSYSRAKKLSQIPIQLSGHLFSLLGVFGTASAALGMYFHRNGQTRLAVLIMGLLAWTLVFLVTPGLSIYLYS